MFSNQGLHLAGARVLGVGQAWPRILERSAAVSESTERKRQACDLRVTFLEGFHSRGPDPHRPGP